MKFAKCDTSTKLIQFTFKDLFKILLWFDFSDQPYDHFILSRRNMYFDLKYIIHNIYDFDESILRIQLTYKIIIL